MPNYYNDESLATITANENLVNGDLVYLNTAGAFSKASNTADTTSSTELMLILDTIASGSEGPALYNGEYTTTGLTAGVKYWVGTSGAYTTTQPTIAGSIVRYIGTALSTTVLNFNPDGLYIEVSSVGGAVVPSYPSVREVTTSGNIILSDSTVSVTTTNDTTQTLPTAVGISGKVFKVKNSDATGVSTVTLNTTSSELIDGNASGTITYQYPDSKALQSNGTNYIII